MNDKIKLLKIDEKYKYKDLCDILCIKKTTGESRNSQFKEISRYALYEKEGHSIVFKEIYDTPKEKEDGRGLSKGSRNNNELYYEHIETIMLYALHNAKDNRVQCSVPKALMLVNMVNNNYSVARSNITATSEIMEIDKKFIYNFYDKTHSKLKGNFERALKKMRSRALVDFQEVTMICKRVPASGTYYNSLGEVILDNNIKYIKEYRMATKDERELILEVENDVLKEMNHKDKQSVYLYGDWNRFKKMVEKCLKKRGNILFYYPAYDIVINRKGINRAVTEDDNLNNKILLNDKVLNSLEKSFKKSDSKYKNTSSFGSVLLSARPEEFADFYESSIKLVDLLIDDNDRNVNLDSDINTYYIRKQNNFNKHDDSIKDDENSEIPF